jgi:hypothetical protein
VNKNKWCCRQIIIGSGWHGGQVMATIIVRGTSDYGITVGVDRDVERRGYHQKQMASFMLLQGDTRVEPCVGYRMAVAVAATTMSLDA